MNIFQRYLYKLEIHRSVKNGVVPVSDKVFQDSRCCEYALAAIIYLNNVGRGTVKIESNGGLLVNAFVFMDYFTECPQKLKYFAPKYAVGSAFLMLISGKGGGRVASKDSFLSICKIDDDEKSDKLRSEIVNRIVGNSKAKHTDAKTWVENGCNFTPQAALAYGLIDEIAECV